MVETSSLEAHRIMQDTLQAGGIGHRAIDDDDSQCDTEDLLVDNQGPKSLNSFMGLQRRSFHAGNDLHNFDAVVEIPFMPQSPEATDMTTGQNALVSSSSPQLMTPKLSNGKTQTQIESRPPAGCGAIQNKRNSTKKLRQHQSRHKALNEYRKKSLRIPRRKRTGDAFDPFPSSSEVEGHGRKDKGCRTSIKEPTRLQDEVFQTTIEDDQAAVPLQAPPVYEKDEAETRLIKKALKKNVLVPELTTKELDVFAKAFEPLLVNDEQVIIQQGSTKGDYFYIIARGRVKFKVNRKVVGSAKKGTSFGELALLYSSPRAATVVAKGDDTKLFRVDQRTFRSMLHAQTKQSEQKKFDLLQSVPPFQVLKSLDIEKLAMCMTPRFFQEGDVLVKQGATMSAFYIIDEGELEMVRRDGDDDETRDSNGDYSWDDVEANRPKDVHSKRLAPGSFFGEQALMAKDVKTVISENEIRAASKGMYFSISRKRFEMIFGKFSRLAVKSVNDRKVLQRVEPFRAAQVTSEQYDELVTLICDEKHVKGKMIFKAVNLTEAALFIVLEGRIKLTGTRLDIVKPGGFFGDENMLVDARQQHGPLRPCPEALARYDAVALEDCVLGVLTLEDCRTVFDTTKMLDKSASNNRAGRVGSISTSSKSNGSSNGNGSRATRKRVSSVSFAATERSAGGASEEFSCSGVAPPSLSSQSTVDWLEEKSSEQLREHIKKDISLDDLERLSVLGEGQFGKVWQVQTDIRTSSPNGAITSTKKHQFALKVQKKVDSRGDKTMMVILREIRILALLDHPFIVDQFHHYEDADNLYILMGLVTGGELFNLIHYQKDDGLWYSGIPESHAKFHCLVVADTLNYIHKRKYLYRDLKPENILIDQDGYPIICDFGFAKYVPNKTYTLCGTLQYLSPEIILNQGHNASVDHWALGVLIYELVCGDNPFYEDGMDQIELFECIVNEDYYPLPSSASDGMFDILDALLEKKPYQRLGSLAGRGKDIVRHPWFAEYDLQQLRQKIVPAPFQPSDASSVELDDDADDDLLS